MAKYSELTTKQKLNLLLIILSIFIIILIFTSFVLPGFFNLINYKITDQFFKARYKIKGREKIDPHVIHVDLNDSSVDALGISEFDRSVYGRVVNVLSAEKVKAIAFDIFFENERNKAQDDIFINAVEKSNAVYLAISPQTKESRMITKANNIPQKEENILDKHIWHPKILKKGKPPVADTIVLNFERLSEVTRGFGHISIDPDEDGIFRHIPLLYQYHDGYIPSLTFSMLLDYLQVNPDSMEVSFGNYIKIKNAKMPLGITKDIKIPIDNSGKILINFAGPWNDSFVHYDFETILNAENNPGKIRDMQDDFENGLVMISDVTTRGKDHGTIPLEKVYPKSGIHTNLLNSILTGSLIKEFGFFQILIINLLFALLLWFLAKRLRAVSFTVYSLIIFILLFTAVFLIFAYANILISLVSLTISFVLSVVAVILYQYFAEQKNYISYILKFNKAAEKFVPKEFLHFLNRDDITEIALGDQVFKKMSVLFSDIRSFTTISEKMTPKENFDFINSYLSKMGPAIRKNNGFIDKYIGDAIMALFPSDPADSVKAALNMKKNLNDYNNNLKKAGKDPIAIGIGINTGDLMLGIVGENERFDGSVISDTVNLASRLESLTKYYHAGIIISENTLNSINKENFIYRFVDFVKVKGKNKPVSIYEIIDNEEESIKKMKIATKDSLDEAFKLYLEKDFEKALGIYNKIIKEFPAEELAIIFKKRCEQLIKSGAPDDWNGSIEMLEK